MTTNPKGEYQADGTGLGHAWVAMVLAGVVAAALVSPAYVLATRWLAAAANAKITGFGSFFGWGTLIALGWILLASLAGLAAGGAAALPARLLHFRARSSQAGLILLGLFLALGSLYLYWMAWAIFEQHAPLSWLPPSAIWAVLQDHLAERTTAGKGLAYAFYAVEALLVWNGVYSGLTLPLEAPFCDRCRQWTRQHEAVAHLRQPDALHTEHLRRSLEAGQFEPLGELGAPREGDAQHLQIDLDVCPSCHQTVYLTVISTKKPPPAPDENLIDAVRSLRDLASPKKWSRVTWGSLLTTIEREALIHRAAIASDDAERLLGFQGPADR